MVKLSSSTGAAGLIADGVLEEELNSRSSVKLELNMITTYEWIWQINILPILIHLYRSVHVIERITLPQHSTTECS